MKKFINWMFSDEVSEEPPPKIVKTSNTEISKLRGISNSKSLFEYNEELLEVWLFAVPDEELCDLLCFGSCKSLSRGVIGRPYVNFGLILAGYPESALARPRERCSSHRIVEALRAIRNWHINGRVMEEV